MTEVKDKGWAVSVDVGGETVLTIGHNHLSGADNIEDYRETVINCAYHLLSFIGEPEREASLLKALEEAKEALLDQLSFMLDKYGEFDLEDCDSDVMCPKCESCGCIKFKIDQIRSALSSIQKDQK